MKTNARLTQGRKDVARRLQPTRHPRTFRSAKLRKHIQVRKQGNHDKDQRLTAEPILQSLTDWRLSWRGALIVYLGGCLWTLLTVAVALHIPL